MLTLYHNDMSVCAAKVRTALAEKGLDWKGVHLDLRRGDAQKPDYLKLNPNAWSRRLCITTGSLSNRRQSVNISMTNGPISHSSPGRALVARRCVFGRSN
jgi:hypothetical protein